MKPAIKIVLGCFTIIIFSYIVYFIVLRTAVQSNNNYNVHFSDMNVMNGQEGRRYVVVLYKKQK